MTPEEAAAKARVHEGAIYDALESGDLRGRLVGRKQTWRIERIDLDHWRRGNVAAALRGHR